MLLPYIKEREYRFKLALRMGLPIFILVLILISSTLITTYESLDALFYIESVLVLAFSVYFIFYIIHSSFDEQITEYATKTFTREYLLKYITQEIQKNKEYTLMLVSVDNLHDINSRYGLKNGDKVLYETVKKIGEYLKSKDIKNFPIGHIKGGDFIVGLKGNKNRYKSILELFCLKNEEFKVDDIEIKISTAITDTSFSKETKYLLENLFELQEEKKNQQRVLNTQEINPNELEASVINAIKEKSFVVMHQDIFEAKKAIAKECFFRLKTPDNKIIHLKNYIKVVNKLGLRSDFDLMLIEEALSIFNGSEKTITISISPTSLRNTLFLTSFKELLRDNEKVSIMLMLNESEYYPNIKKFNKIIKSLKEMGVLVAVDRLGSIHTSFLYLRDLDIDVVRLDSFYTKELNFKQHQAIVDGLNLMAHTKGIKTWVKMVENATMQEEFKKMGIDYLQGKYLAPLQKFEK